MISHGFLMSTDLTCFCGGPDAAAVDGTAVDGTAEDGTA